MTSHDEHGRPPQPPPHAMSAVMLLEEIRAGLDNVTLPLALPGVDQARRDTSAARAQLDDYILPRYRSLDAPLLAVVGGSTGAGKSTLVNGLVGHPVTRAGAIRPTTRQPILLHSPTEAAWFEGRRVLPGLARIRGTLAAGPSPAGRPGEQSGAADSLVLVADPAVPAGIALLDAPDVDSISDHNRLLAGLLLAAADLWVFVTTANRYADAVPWKLLLDAASRDITVAVVLDRVPQGAEAEVSQDLRGLLDREGLAGSRLFIIAETVLEAHGMLPAGAVDELREWLASLASDAAGRADVARRTLNGTVRALAQRITDLAGSVREQERAAARLEADAVAAYGDAAARILDATRDGALLRGEVLARWQDFVGTGEFFRTLEQNVGRFRDRLGAFFRGEPAPAVRVEAAIETGLQAVIVDEAANAAEDTDRRWRSDPAGRQLMGPDDLSGTSPGFADRAAAEIRAWQQALMEMIRTEGQGKRTQARWLSFGINGLGAALMIVVFSMTAGLTGLEIGVAGGTAVVGQRLLEAVFGEDAVRRMADKARDDLAARCSELLKVEQQKFLQRLPAGNPALAQTLAAQAGELARLAERA
ncbi:dynamin family protein [Pseudarthrobacter sp. NPDC058119]|uniref:dynamin family protein n=1 Tax=Pseudarthrobacter sp. NPDC058119 TaxID=3346348 RepID=UPI0036DC1496